MSPPAGVVLANSRSGRSCQKMYRQASATTTPVMIVVADGRRRSRARRLGTLRSAGAVSVVVVVGAAAMAAPMVTLCAEVVGSAPPKPLLLGDEAHAGGRKLRLRARNS